MESYCSSGDAVDGGVRLLCLHPSHDLANQMK